MTGTPVSTTIRRQFNLEVKPLKNVDIMSNLRKLLFPMYWIEESAHMNSEKIDAIRKYIYKYVLIHVFVLVI